MKKKVVIDGPKKKDAAKNKGTLKRKGTLKKIDGAKKKNDPKNDPKKMANAFFDSICSERVLDAYDALFEGSYIARAHPDVLTKLKKQTLQGLQKYGDVLGFEILSEEKLGSCIFKSAYALKFKLTAVIFEFVFYNPSSDKERWYPAIIEFNDQFYMVRTSGLNR